MNLRDLQLDVEYRSDQSRIVENFYIPCLARATKYWRAVGYFTSDGLALAAEGLAEFIRNGGTMRLVASPKLTEEDQESILRGYEERGVVIERALLREITPVSIEASFISRSRLECVAWLVAAGRLDVKLAIPDFRSRAYGIYHEKVGIFFDSQDNAVAFTGSANETIGGLLCNFEAVDVFASWDDPQDRVRRKVASFQSLWADTTQGLEIVDFPEAVRRRLVELAPDQPPTVELATARRLSPYVKLRPYQEQAVEAWATAGYRGILAMATGSGKTITALTAVTRVAGRQRPLFVVITCPFQHLVEQWAQECERFGIHPILAYQSRRQWEEILDTQILDLNLGSRDLVVVIVTHTTLNSPMFASLIGRVGQCLFMVADEAHHLGAPGLSQDLPMQATYRLGLSATPERWLDERGTATIHQYFGPTVFEYSLEQAIDDRRLTPYLYHPHIVELTDDEMYAYEEISQKIGKLYAVLGTGGDGDERIEALLRQRANLLNKAQNKLPILRSLVMAEKDIRHAMVYCAPGQIDEVIRLLGVDLHLRVHPFTAQEDTHERSTLLHDFAAGHIQALVAMKCLDEGVDVPITRTAYILASSSNPREFIQRRGRILRRADGKDFATIHDLITVPPKTIVDATSFHSERGIVKRELARFKEFAHCATNRLDAEVAILDVARRYNLLDY